MMLHKSRTIQYEENLNYGASHEIIAKARDLRKRMTKPEKVLWYYLKDKKFEGLKFRRQHPIWIFIADFYCHEIKLVIELDGGIHQRAENKEHDLNRTAEIEKWEIKVMRFTNEDVLGKIDTVLKQIKVEIDIRRIQDPIPGPCGGILPLKGELEGVF